MWGRSLTSRQAKKRFGSLIWPGFHIMCMRPSSYGSYKAHVATFMLVSILGDFDWYVLGNQIDAAMGWQHV